MIFFQEDGDWRALVNSLASTISCHFRTQNQIIGTDLRIKWPSQCRWRRRKEEGTSKSQKWITHRGGPWATGYSIWTICCLLRAEVNDLEDCTKCCAWEREWNTWHLICRLSFVTPQASKCAWYRLQNTVTFTCTTWMSFPCALIFRVGYHWLNTGIHSLLKSLFGHEW